MTATTTLPVLFATGLHAARPAANAVGSGGLYSCTTHSLVYQTDGVSTWSTWANLAGTGLADPMTTRGDVIVRNAANATARLGIGSAGKILSSDGTDISWGNGPLTTQDDIIVGGASGIPTRLAKGSDSQVLTVDPSTHHLVWATPSAGFTNPMTTKGDVIVGDTGGAAIRKAVGSDGQVLTADSASTGGIKWDAAGAGSGTVTTVKDEGSTLSSAVVSLDFVGAGVTATGTTAVTVTIPGGGGSALVPTLVQWKEANAAATTIILDAAPTSGNLLILASDSTSGQITSVASTNTTWTQIKTATSAGSSFYSIWVGVVAGSASATITCSKPGSFNSMAVIELSGAPSVTPALGQSVAGGQGSGTSRQLLPATTAGHLIIFAGGTDNTATGGMISASHPVVGIPYAIVPVLAALSQGGTMSANGLNYGSAGEVMIAEIT